MKLNKKIEASVLELLIVFGGCYVAGTMMKWLKPEASVIGVLVVVVFALTILLRRSMKGEG